MVGIITPNNVGSQLRIVRIILSRFSKAVGILITVPVVQYSEASQTVKITVGYISNGIGSLGMISTNLVNVLGDYLSQVIGIKVNLVLVNVGNHYSDASLLVQYLSSLIGGSSQASHTFKTVILRLAKFIAFTKANTIGGYNHNSPMTFKGLRVQVSGRLTTEPTRPRQTVQEFTIGSFKSNRIQSSSFTSVNAKGTITIKVWLGI